MKNLILSTLTIASLLVSGAAFAQNADQGETLSNSSEQTYGTSGLTKFDIDTLFAKSENAD